MNKIKVFLGILVSILVIVVTIGMSFVFLSSAFKNQPRTDASKKVLIFVRKRKGKKPEPRTKRRNLRLQVLVQLAHQAAASP